MYAIIKGTRGIILKLEHEGEQFCLRLPAGVPDDGQNRLAIEVDCPEDITPEEKGEIEAWIWLDRVKRVFLRRKNGEELFTMRYWKDVRWFVMKGEGGVEVSAGGVPVICEQGNIYAFIIKPSGKENYALPKGLIERGENPEETAVREVAEETGLKVEAGPLIDKVNYQYRHPEKGIRIYKEVLYFLLTVTGGDPSNHDWEVAEVKRVPLVEADTYLKFPSEKRVVKKLLERVKNGEIIICR